jgi:hypothetical protein
VQKAQEIKMGKILTLEKNENIGAEIEYLEELLGKSSKKTALLVDINAGGELNSKAALIASGVKVTLVCGKSADTSEWSDAEIIKTHLLDRLPFKQIIWIPDAGCMYAYGNCVLGFPIEESELTATTAGILNRFLSFANLSELSRYLKPD